jgi:hypothetical protein
MTRGEARLADGQMWKGTKYAHIMMPHFHRLGPIVRGLSATGVVSAPAQRSKMAL